MQAINVVYKLAEHPDVVCERLIKNLAKAVLIDQPSGLKAANEIVPGEGRFVFVLFSVVIITRFSTSLFSSSQTVDLEII